MGGLAMIGIETQCETTKCSILAKLIKEKNQSKTWTGVMWHLDQYRKVKQRVSIIKTYIGNTDRAPNLLTYITFLCSWSNLTGNQITCA